MTVIKIIHKTEPKEEIPLCNICNSDLEQVPMKLNDGSTSERSIFGFSLTHKKDGTPIKDLETKGPHLGTVEVGWCSSCRKHSVVLDSLEDDPEQWAKLPKWEQPI